MSQFGIRQENAGTSWDNLRIMLKKVRLLCGYSHADVATALGISRSTYTYYERGKSLPDMVTLVALAQIFGIPPESFFHPEEFSDLETVRKRAPKKATVETNSIGDLSPEERRLVAEYRLMKGRAEGNSGGR